MAVLDHEDKVQGHIDLNIIGGGLPMLTDLQPRQALHTLLPNEKVLANTNLVVVSVPAQHANGRQVGTAVVGLNQSYVDEMVARPRQAFLMLTIGLLVAGVGISLLIMSVLLRPLGALRAGLERIGRGDLASPIQLNDKTELGLLAETVDGMAGQLLKSQAEMLEKERLGAEMSLAHQMQQSLLPDGEIRQGSCVCHGAYAAAAEVGGDYYDIIERIDGRLGLVIADVSGKGLAGCLVTSMLAVLIRSLHNRYESPSDLLVNLEKDLLSTLAPGTFITVFYGILDPETGLLVFASAGHCPLAIYRANKNQVDWTYTKGIPVGAMRNGALAKTLADSTVLLAPGDVALQYTDGLNEAWNAQQQEQFEFNRIAEYLVETAPQGSQSVLENLLPRIEAWTAPDPLGDDFTLLAVERIEVPSIRETTDHIATPTTISVLRRREHLEEMMDDAKRLYLPSRMEDLALLTDWVADCLDGRPELADCKDLVETSLFEVCANIIEHGYRNQGGHELALWWVPTTGTEQEWSAAANNEDGPRPDGIGYFMVCDQGTAFKNENWTPPDLQDPKVRRRGRGLGWQIVHLSMKRVVYTPNTPAGNLTLLRFDPAKTPVR